MEMIVFTDLRTSERAAFLCDENGNPKYSEMPPMAQVNARRFFDLLDQGQAGVEFMSHDALMRKLNPGR